jgi:hypothetical protein
LFDWKSSKLEANTAWAGYLWSPRLYRPLMELLKECFLQTANNYSELGKHSEQYVALLTLAALEPVDTFTTKELAVAFNELPSDGLSKAVGSLINILESSGDQHENYWTNRIEPFWKKVWPKATEKALNINGESIALLCIAAGSEFSLAIKLIGNWLKNIDYPDYAIHKLHESNLHSQFPESTLHLLNAIISDAALYLPTQLRDCLNTISQAEPPLLRDRKYIRLDELARRYCPLPHY